MNKFVFIIFLLISGTSFGQIADRVVLEGKITVPPGDDPEGIAIFNTDTKRGTVSTNNGEFSIIAGLGDRLVFSALQFQDFTVIVDQATIDTKELNVIISEAVTPLPEVVVSPNELTGIVRVDLKRIPVAEANFPDVTASEIQYYEYDFRPDELTSPENAVMEPLSIEYGLQFVNIFKAIFDERNEEKAERKTIDDKIRNLYDDEFFQKYLDLEYENINDFIFYAENHGLTPLLLEEGNELELIQFLINTSEEYKKQEEVN